MTSEATELTEGARKLIESVRFVLFDFDGPICRLFAGHAAPLVARKQVRWLEERGLHGLLANGVREEPDPYVVLRAVDRRRPGSDLVAELGERLTREELTAVETARPTAYADVLIRTWSAVGVRLGVATNNSPRAVRRYLAARGLTGCFAPHIYGRTEDLRRLKPDPYCVQRALGAMGAAPPEVLMIGDAPSDFHAARAAGVHFLGYARNRRKEGLLREAGARHTVSSLLPVVRSLTGGG
ncbi:HAD family hydrolase [Streptomyces longispororuber]|uniref:HAD family hydrolase n=1 Tax=Streptomyces longispororuber TaxID=68230 RepID=UPI0036F5E62A